MAREKFCLRWNDFETNISLAFRELRDDKDFFDVTLACDDEQIQAHKMILSACSPFFRNILRRNPHQHPLLYLKGVKYTDLQSVLNFMYHGEVNVAQEELNSFLAVAEDLRIKGLTQNQSGHSPRQTRTRSPPLPKPLPRAPEENHNPPAKRSRPPPPPVHDKDDDIQEVIPIKSEPIPSAPHPVQEAIAEPQAYSSSIPMDSTHGQSLTAYQEDTGYEEYGDYEDQAYSQGDIQPDQTINMQGQEHGKGSYAEFLEECVRTKVTKNDSSRSYSCNICGKLCGDLSIARFHLESKHFPNFEGYHCPYCSKFCKTKNALGCHKMRCRKSFSQI